MKLKSNPCNKLTNNQNLLIIIVLYKQALHNCVSYSTILTAMKNSTINASILIYDNSPRKQEYDDYSKNIILYYHDRTNSGLATAYNHALDVAQNKKYAWILLLDQDSIVHKDFLDNLQNIITEVEKTESVVAIVPRVFHGNQIVSPARFDFLGRIKPLRDSDINEISPTEITAINSGTVVRTRFLLDIEGFNSEFRIDYLDHWLFSVIYANKKFAYLSNNVIKHDLSIVNYDIGLDRYRNILKSENSYYRNFRRFEQYIFLKIRRIFRTGKLLINGRYSLALATLKSIIHNY